MLTFILIVVVAILLYLLIVWVMTSGERKEIRKFTQESLNRDIEKLRPQGGYHPSRKSSSDLQCNSRYDGNNAIITSCSTDTPSNSTEWEVVHLVDERLI